MIYSLKAIEPIAITRPIYVRTDNAHVLRLHKWNPVNHRQKRMITYLMGCSATNQATTAQLLTYVKGCKNVVPDCLSRIFTDAPDYIKNKNAPTQIREADDFLFTVTTRAKTKSDNAHANAHAMRQAEQFPHIQHQQQCTQSRQTRPDVQHHLSSCRRRIQQHQQQGQANAMDDSSIPDITAPHIAADGAADIADVADRVGTPPVYVADRHATGDLSDKQTTDACLLYTSPSPRDRQKSRMPSSA